MLSRKVMAPSRCSTYQANDGAPAGEYKITVNNPLEPVNRYAQHPLPEKYAKKLKRRRLPSRSKERQERRDA